MKILAVLAHPDDEAFGPAGTLSRYSLTGHAVRLATMTHGEAGTLGPAKDLTSLELGSIRSDELRRSAEALHLSGLNIYTLPDGKLAALPAEQGIGIIRQEIEMFSPDALLTFHSGGISGHPDHRTVARWCLSAINESSRPLRLFAYGVSGDQARRVTHRKLAPIPDIELTHILDVSKYLEYKFAAIRCHQSQAEAWARMKSIEGGIEAYLHNEHFSQVWPAQKQPAQTRATSLED
jgi:LmbE family N-acetylglucosaminyl deacetylase